MTRAKSNENLVLGIDDFVIKKSHTNNTGIYDLKGETMLDLFPERKLEDLRANAKQHPYFLVLAPEAVVMDLTKGYHARIRKRFQMQSESLSVDSV